MKKCEICFDPAEVVLAEHRKGTGKMCEFLRQARMGRERRGGERSAGGKIPGYQVLRAVSVGWDGITVTLGTTNVGEISGVGVGGWRGLFGLGLFCSMSGFSCCS